MRKSDEERFWAKVEKTEGCWNWKAFVTPDGYGLCNRDQKTRYAHRMSFELSNGKIQDGFVVDHTCHNRACVNPAHLRLATRKQNQENRAGATSLSKTGIRGVTWAKRERKWRGTIGHNLQYIHVGYFDTIADAEAAVIAKRLELFTHNDADKKAA